MTHMPKPVLTPELIDNICTRLKAGAFEQVAVESLGVPLAVYQMWLERGRRKGARGLYRRLAQSVMEAKAHARFAAEMNLRTEDEKTWLLNGPGRDSPGQPGWGPASRSAAAEDAGDARALVLELAVVVLKALEPHQEIRAQVAAALDEWSARREGHERP
jgi:hypothetical protein